MREQWRREYPNSGVVKPGQTQAGSGTTPTILAGGKLVAITDNADPMNVLAYRRAVDPKQAPAGLQGAGVRRGHIGDRSEPDRRGEDADRRKQLRLLDRGDQSGGTRNPASSGCRSNGLRGLSDGLAVGGDRAVRAAEGVFHDRARLHLHEAARVGSDDPWYLTALDFETGETRWKRLAGEGLGFNNNYAPITIGPQGRTTWASLAGWWRSSLIGHSAQARSARSSDSAHQRSIRSASQPRSSTRMR